MIENPLISVVIPAYNCEQFILSSINSILNQKYQNIEILIADDSSTDNTRRLIDSITDDRIKRFHNDKNLGYLFTCNKLIQYAKGDFIAMQDADDISEPTRFKKQLEAFDADIELGICGVNMVVIDENDQEIEKTNWGYNINDLLKNKKFDFIQNSFLIKIDVIKNIGFYHPYFDRIGFEDFYWTYLCSEKYKIVNLQERLYQYRKCTNIKTISNSFPRFTQDFSFISLLILIEQRRDTGSDFLEQSKKKELMSLVYRKMLGIAIDKNEFASGQKVIPKLIKVAPFDIMTYRTVSYFLRKRIMNKMK